MPRFNRLSRAAAVLALASTMGLAALPVSAAQLPAPVLQLSSPLASGTVLEPAPYLFTGVAFDKNATTGAGIDRVQLFLDADRDQGGQLLAEARPLDPAAAVTPDSMIAGDDFQLSAPALSPGAHTLYAYAYSSVTNEETVVAIPVTVSTDA